MRLARALGTLALLACHNRVVAVDPVAVPTAPPPAAPSPTVAPLTAPKHVIIISEDGLRPDVLSESLTPAHMRLMRAGMTARQARTIPDSDTLPSHASMLSGFGAKQHGMSWNSFHPERGVIHVPTIFSIATQHGLSTAMFVGKPKLRHLIVPGSVGHFERPSYLCRGVATRAASYFVEERPTLMFVHFSDPDEYGHAQGWMSKSYLRGVRQSDACLGQLLGAVDGAGLTEETLVIVTADHGGHDHVHSGARRAIDQDIPWIVRGPGVQSDVVLDATVSTMDTAATALSALRLPMPPEITGLPRIHFD